MTALMGREPRCRAVAPINRMTSAGEQRNLRQAADRERAAPSDAGERR